MSWEKFWTDLQTWVKNTGIKLVIALVVLIVSFIIIKWLSKAIEKRGKKLEETKKVDKTIYRTLSHVTNIAFKDVIVDALIGYV